MQASHTQQHEQNNSAKMPLLKMAFSPTSLDRTLAANKPKTGYGLTCPSAILNIADFVVKNSTLKVKGMAIATHKTAAVLRNELNGCERHKLGLIDAINHSMIADDYAVLIEWARLGGLGVVHLPCVDSVDDIELMNSYARFIKEVGDLSKCLDDTLADRKVTAAEMTVMNKEAREVIQGLYSFIANLESRIED